MTVVTKARLVFLTLLCSLPVSATARDTGSAASKAEVTRELRAFFAGQDQANRDGLSSTQLATRFYSDDAIVIGEGDTVPQRGIKGAVAALDGWFAELGPNGNKGCAFKVQDTVVASGDLAAVFATLSCKPNPPKLTKEETIRQLFVVRRTAKGWRVTREMWQTGPFSG